MQTFNKKYQIIVSNLNTLVNSMNKNFYTQLSEKEKVNDNELKMIYTMSFMELNKQARKINRLYPIEDFANKEKLELLIVEIDKLIDLYQDFFHNIVIFNEHILHSIVTIEGYNNNNWNDFMEVCQQQLLPSRSEPSHDFS